jgi:SpoVK/Ycf46/Vps4 family AAA+-type ATPase
VQALASQLGRALIRVDLRAALSKYIGETEKNLAAIFNQAARNHAILYFDEADALFGHRTDVDSASDRYANLEVSHLLRRIDTHPGIVILATNRIGNLDRKYRIVKVSADPE